MTRRYYVESMIAIATVEAKRQTKCGEDWIERQAGECRGTSLPSLRSEGSCYDAGDGSTDMGRSSAVVFHCLSVIEWGYIFLG